MGNSIYGVYAAPPIGVHDEACGVILGKFGAETADLFERSCANCIVRTDTQWRQTARIAGLETSVERTFDM